MIRKDDLENMALTGYTERQNGQSETAHNLPNKFVKWMAEHRIGRIVKE